MYNVLTTPLPSSPVTSFPLKPTSTHTNSLIIVHATLINNARAGSGNVIAASATNHLPFNLAADAPVSTHALLVSNDTSSTQKDFSFLDKDINALANLSPQILLPHDDSITPTVCNSQYILPPLTNTLNPSSSSPNFSQIQASPTTPNNATPTPPPSSTPSNNVYVRQTDFSTLYIGMETNPAKRPAEDNFVIQKPTTCDEPQEKQVKTGTATNLYHTNTSQAKSFG